MKKFTKFPGLCSAVAAACALIFGLAGCGAAGDATSMSSPSTSNLAQPSSTPSGGMVDIGGGRKVYAECAGSGSPTVVLESGDESDHDQWRLVAPRLAERTRTCFYDRLGNGASDEPTGCRRMKDLRGDLEVLLSALGEDGPVGSGCGAVPGLPSVGFHSPPAEPGVRLSPHRALHVRVVVQPATVDGVHGVGMWYPR
jgi:hypothetical protein